MLRVFLDTVTPQQYAISPKETLLAMLMHKKFEIPVLTTREAVGKTTPSKHETSYGTQYRNVCIVGPAPNITQGTRLPKRQMSVSVTTINSSSLYFKPTLSQ